MLFTYRLFKVTVDPPTSYAVLMVCSAAPTSFGLSCSATVAGTLEFIQGWVQADVLELKGWGHTWYEFCEPSLPSITCLFSVLMCATDVSTDRIVPLFAAASGKNRIYITKCIFPAKTQSEVRRQPLIKKKETLKQITYIH